MTLQQIIEQGAERYKGAECLNELHKPGCECEDVDFISGFKQGANFALGLSRWVKVEDGLPERKNPPSWPHDFSITVLITDGEFIDMAYYNFGTNQWYSLDREGFDYDLTTHWQPLPAPPTGK